MNYYVQLQYYCIAPVHKNVKSSPLKYHTGHQHGVQPTIQQIDSLQGDLEAAVDNAYQNAGGVYPGNDAVQQGREVVTWSAK